MLLRALTNVKAIGCKHPQWQADCPLCGDKGKLGVAYAPHRQVEFASHVIAKINCYNCGARHPRSYAEALLEHLGGEPAGFTLSRVMEANEWYLPFAVGSETWVGDPGHEREPSDLPDEDDVFSWCESLLEDSEFRRPLRHLIEDRGLSKEMIALHGIGYKTTFFGHHFPEPCFTIPVRDASGKLVDLRQRAWPGKKQYRGLPGHPSNLYPLPMVGPYRIICEGEFDALLGRYHGLPTVTGTAGTTFKQEWIERFSKRLPIFVTPDPEGYDAAIKTAEKFRAAGYEDVWPINLGKDGKLKKRGLQPKEDLTDWFVKYGREADELTAFLWAERKRLRRARKARR